jgi:type VI secretion system secreted protein VgrG
LATSDYPQEIIVTLPNAERGAIYAERVDGHEALGQTYEYTVDLVSRDRLSLEPMLGGAATLEMRVHDENAVVRGVVAAARTRDVTHAGDFCYQVVIAPEFGMLKYSAQNQVYGTDGDVTLTDIIEAEMRDANKAGSKTATLRPPRQLDYQMLLDRDDYPGLPFVMQYRESDYDFICRLLEKFGATFRFDHDGKREKVVFIDQGAHFPAVNGHQLGKELPFRPRTHSVGYDRFAVRSFNADYVVSSGAVALREYNWQTPGVNLDVDCETSFGGQGVTTFYGEHYRTEAEGEFLAGRRAELLKAQRRTFRGTSDIPLMRPGYYFQLDGHAESDLDGLYKIVEVTHAMTAPAQQGYGSASGASRIYENSFVCIPFDTEYRPALRTPRPVVNGFMLAVTTEGPDKWGNYTVRILEDESGRTGGEASHSVRKAEFSTSGDGSGVATKLELGTEVMLIFRHGNPDRPVIVGAVSNAEQTSTITSENQGVAYLQKTNSGIVMRFSDGG